MMADSVVYIGNKPFMNYVTAVVIQFNNQGVNEITIKARGRYITRAVDVAEVVRKKFLAGQVDVKEVKIDSETFVDQATNREKRVSVIEITLARKQ